MLRVAFVGGLSSSFADPVRAHLTIPCDFIHTDEGNARDVLPDVDVLVTLVFTSEMGAAANTVLQGAGLIHLSTDRHDTKMFFVLPRGVSVLRTRQAAVWSPRRAGRTGGSGVHRRRDVPGPLPFSVPEVDSCRRATLGRGLPRSTHSHRAPLP